jgi:hypothetical protein
VHEASRQRVEGLTYKTGNFLGLRKNTGVGSSAKHIINMTAAARLRPPKTRSLSHRLTVHSCAVSLESRENIETIIKFKWKQKGNIDRSENDEHMDQSWVLHTRRRNWHLITLAI